MNKLLTFFRAPLNQGALVAISGAGLAVLQGSMTWQHAVPIAVGAIVAWIIPDNSVAKEEIEVLVADAIKVASDMASKPKT